MSQPTPKQKFLPLREITLNSRPLIKRAIKFSCDGELAVAADDSVHVFVPEYPDISKQKEEKEARRKAAAASRNDPHYEGELSSEDENDNDDYTFCRNKKRAQYSEGSKHMPVSYPPLDPGINKELFVTAGLPFPYDGAGNAYGQGAASDDEADLDSSDSDDDNDNDEAAASNSNRPFGAGYGPITGVGSSMNHVVTMDWSPSGLGMNRRPILAILTGAGTLAMYGDGNSVTNILPRANEGMLQHRELVSWMVLWGVGERLILPGQQTEISEYIRGFAWAREIAPGQALLATINDVGEVAIISVQTIFTMDESKTKGNFMSTEPIESLVWLVKEIARFKAVGPHPKGSRWDEDFVPCGTSFGINFSPWLQTGDSRSCVLSFVDRNYVGFRKITIDGLWARGESPNLKVDEEDLYGNCLHLSTDAFVEFEDVVWTRGGINYCRGIVSTGFHIKPFEVALFGGAPYHQESHTPKVCGTTYSDETIDEPTENPIVDLVVHAPDFNNPPAIPLYTLIRMSANVNNLNFWESNRVEIGVPADLHLKRGYGGESDSDNDSMGGVEPADGEDLEYLDDYENEAEADNTIDENDNTADVVIPEIPEIHPYRLRLHGLAASPGGGATAVISSHHSTQHPERGGWHTVRSVVSFGYRPRRRQHADDNTGPQQQQQQQQLPDPSIPHAHVEPLTTEARLFEWLYGGGPLVPGINMPSREEDGQDRGPAAMAAQLERLRALFRPAIEQQTCDLCGSRMECRGAVSGCAKGHFFGTCATSGLAVQMPGITRSCGACGLRTMRAEVLVAKMPDRRAEIMREVGEGVCGGCGGKFLN
ncbi:hypothetical protein B0T17DRAFT_613298 [Bombardia bombarda]|uniref:Uncharacterized protein n=1 Tax=Bombardia bombarda TaxID=252184 RepID=A0AA39XM54_9PEZI|nr:hypothetical protein B0T17DRAFT_613298 [Bombardia bombarda]